MPYYKDLENTNPNTNGIWFIDDIDHEHALPPTCIPITDAEGKEIEDAWIAEQEAKAALVPNPAAFIQACKTAIGLSNLIGNPNLFSVVQLAVDAIQQDQMADLQAIITSAQSSGLITATQYSAIKSAAIQFNIPVTLP